MSLGPTTIFDKSALQALSVEEAMWFDQFYHSNTTPLFYVETLADLEKHDDRRGRHPDQLVRELAKKTPLNGYPNVHHGSLCLGELLGHRFEMRGVPAIPAGRRVRTRSQTGLSFDQAPEVDAFQRWGRGEFHEIERLFVRKWRQALSAVDLKGVYERY